MQPRMTGALSAPSAAPHDFYADHPTSSCNLIIGDKTLKVSSEVITTSIFVDNIILCNLALGNNPEVFESLSLYEFFFLVNKCELTLQRKV